MGCGMALWIGKQIDGADGLFYASPEALEAVRQNQYEFWSNEYWFCQKLFRIKK